ncbi:hypothetical protein [Actinomadura sp. WAC 06369]|uniref:hypothetical protein n=1 Tax=Actinomadura sp. WAC 06369 TaxID=2203193 RepID=UPI0010029B54|nr:hypothetical protein [Actinomadura sp. WAC 06369]RSN46563.1 hypothetical protein DMH08_35700 [Actinomadura sp. WAC 06369]
MAEGLVRVVAWVPRGTEARLGELVQAERARRRLMVAEDPRWDTSGRTADERAAVKLARVAWLADLRGRGELLDTSAAVLALGVRGELAARGWDHEWPPAPETAVSGRWWGSRAEGFPERVAANLPVALVDQVRAACWHSSPIAELRAWRDRRPGPLRGALRAEYDQLAAGVKVPGEIWRGAYRRVLGWPSTHAAEDAQG